jgi:uncharacterized protein YbjT (DUF2867 family)
VENLKKKGHDAIAAAPNKGVNTITGEGLKQAMAGTEMVIDLANSPSFEDKAVLEFFETSGRNLLAAEAAAGIRHHAALSILGTDRSDNGYFRADRSRGGQCRDNRNACSDGDPGLGHWLLLPGAAPAP